MCFLFSELEKAMVCSEEERTEIFQDERGNSCEIPFSLFWLV